MQKRKAPATAGAFGIRRQLKQLYLIAVVMLLNVVLSLLPRPCTTVMIATEMPAAIRPYSMAVAPDSSLAKRLRVFMGRLLWSTRGCLSTVRPGLFVTRCDSVRR